MPLTSTPISEPLIADFLSTLREHQSSTLRDDPNYYANNPDELCTSCVPLSFSIGTGEAVLSDLLCQCLSAQHEILLVTCFWAKSASQRLISAFLRQLSARACADNRTVRVRICFSSLSLLQKLFHTSSLSGQVYDASTWESKFGLPEPQELPGVDLRIKSIFVRPFSVMHPKFVVVDRMKAFLPSCNVSFEEWFEGCIEVEGELVGKLVKFWRLFWGRDEAFPDIELVENGESVASMGSEMSAGSLLHAVSSETSSTGTSSNPRLLSRISFSNITPVPALFLPSPHHINPAFRPFPFGASAPPPATPLNLFLTHIFSAAQKSIFIQSPNFTSLPAISSIRSAFARGVDVQLITSSMLMIMEQLVTAGTITEFCFWLLKRFYRKLVAQETARIRTTSIDIEAGAQSEEQEPRPGKLCISYYSPRLLKPDVLQGHPNEPQKSHLKLVIVDERVVVLGSGNQDRASWYTSQELGVAIFSSEIAKRIKTAVEEALEGRVDRWAGSAQ